MEHLSGCRLLACGSGEEQALGAADERIAAFEETQRKIGRARDADANSFADGAGGMLCHAEPERAGCAEVYAIVAAVDEKGGGQAAGAAGEIEKATGVAVLLHQFDSIERLKGAYENGGGDSCWLADDVEHEVRAVVEKDVGVALGEIHGANARGGAAEMVAGGIARRIGFGFDDASADAAIGKVVDNHFADEEACKGDGV